MSDTDAWVPSQIEQQRRAYRASRGRRSGLIAVVSTVVVLAVAALLIVNSPGWDRTRETFFSWEDAKKSFPSVLSGLWLNVRVMVICGICIAIWATLIAVMRTLRGPVFFPLRAFAVGYTDVFRGLPMLLVLLLLGYGVPALNLSGVPDSFLFWGCVGLVLSYSAYVAEVLRAGIESIHPSQRMAARSLGLSYPQTLRHVVLPQAVRRVLPALMNDLVSLQKDSSLLSVLAVVDALRAAQIYSALTFNYTSYVVAGLLFLCLTIPMARLTDWYARRQGFQSTGGLL
ncbi:amino acid ABC transporter permease [Branchiibius cervicis]|uniref:Amino acid ABC transporter permease n=1 Tax=Branchiibius cervicis TaxID=908252 RepID=A0ABW2AWR8_9MICO